MNRRNLFFAAIAMAMFSLAVFTGCKEKEEPDPPQEKPTFQWTETPGIFEGGVLSVSAEGGALEVAYVLENPVEGAVLEATTDASWISSITAAEGRIAFEVAANDQSEMREAKITVSYPELVPAPEMTVRQEGVKKAEVSVSATYDKYYDMHAIAEINPDFEFYTDFGDCFMPINVTTTPEDATFWMGVFVNTADLTDEVLMNELMMRPPAENKDDASALWYNKEYVIAAVAQNADGDMSEIWRSEPFTLTAEGASDAQGFFDWSNGGEGGGDEAAVSISATFDEYYDMHAIAEIDPDFEFYTDFGDCFMPVFVTVEPEDAMFWMGVFVNTEDLTDEVLMNELMMRPPAESKDDAPALWYNKEYIVAAVAQNADGEMSALWKSEPFVLLADYASPAQGFFDWANGGPAAASLMAR